MITMALGWAITWVKGKVFGGSSGGGSNLILYVLVGVAILAVVGFAYLHYTSLVKENATLKASTAKLELAVTQQQLTIDYALSAIQDWKAEVAKMQRTMEALSRVQEEARAPLRRLNDVLARHDLEALTRAKPGLVESRINRGSSELFRLLGDETAGSEDRPR